MKDLVLFILNSEDYTLVMKVIIEYFKKPAFTTNTACERLIQLRQIEQALDESEKKHENRDGLYAWYRHELELAKEKLENV